MLVLEKKATEVSKQFEKSKSCNQRDRKKELNRKKEKRALEAVLEADNGERKE